MMQKVLLEYCEEMRGLLEVGNIELAKKSLDSMIKGLRNESDASKQESEAEK